jgi:hypothetical protein
VLVRVPNAPQQQPQERPGTSQPEHGPHHYQHEWAQPEVLPRVDEGRLRVLGIVDDRHVLADLKR